MSYLVIDHELSQKDGAKVGEHIIDIDAVNLTGCQNPTGLPDPITMVQYLAWLNADPVRREKAGWHVRQQLAHEAVPTSRWDRLIAATKQLPPEHAVHAIKLA